MEVGIANLLLEKLLEEILYIIALSILHLLEIHISAFYYFFVFRLILSAQLFKTFCKLLYHVTQINVFIIGTTSLFLQQQQNYLVEIFFLVRCTHYINLGNDFNGESFIK